MIETKIIGKDDSIDIKYYDILYFCEKKVKEYISKSEENLNEFKEFRKKYKTFDPYFDFVFLKLDYISTTPLFYHIHIYSFIKINIILIHMKTKIFLMKKRINQFLLLTFYHQKKNILKECLKKI